MINHTFMINTLLGLYSQIYLPKSKLCKDLHLCDRNHDSHYFKNYQLQLKLFLPAACIRFRHVVNTFQSSSMEVFCFSTCLTVWASRLVNCSMYVANAKIKLGKVHPFVSCLEIVLVFNILLK